MTKVPDSGKMNLDRTMKRALPVVLLILIAAARSTAMPLLVPQPAERGISSNLMVGTLSTFTDNVFLDTTNRRAALSQHIVPHFDFDYRSARLNLNLDYTGDYSFYTSGGERLKNTLHYSRLGGTWNWQRYFSLQFYGDLSERPIDLTKGGGIISQALVVGSHFRPPAVNSVLTRTLGTAQRFSRKLNGQTVLEADYSATSIDYASNWGRDMVMHGPNARLLHSWSKRLDTAVRSSWTFQRYEGDIRRENTMAVLENSYSLSSRISMVLGLGAEKLRIENPGEALVERTSLFADLALNFEKLPRTRLTLDYGRRSMSDISARVFKVDELGLSASHDLGRRLTTSLAFFSRWLELVATESEPGIKDWIGGVEWQIEYAVSKDIRPVVSVEYVKNGGQVKLNDFDNLRVSTGFRYYFFSLN